MCQPLLFVSAAGFPFSSTDLLRIEASSLIHQATNGVTITCTTGNERSLQECVLVVQQVSRFRRFEFAAIKCIGKFLASNNPQCGGYIRFEKVIL